MGHRLLTVILTVRPSDNILQKSILRGHKSPPTSRHSASSLRRLQVRRSRIRSACSWCLRLRAAGCCCWCWWSCFCCCCCCCRAVCLLRSLSCVSLSPVRCSGASLPSRAPRYPGDDDNAWAHRTGGAAAPLPAPALANWAWSTTCWTGQSLSRRRRVCLFVAASLCWLYVSNR